MGRHKPGAAAPPDSPLSPGADAGVVFMARKSTSTKRKTTANASPPRRKAAPKALPKRTAKTGRLPPTMRKAVGALYNELQATMPELALDARMFQAYLGSIGLCVGSVEKVAAGYQVTCVQGKCNCVPGLVSEIAWLDHGADTVSNQLVQAAHADLQAAWTKAKSRVAALGPERELTIILCDGKARLAIKRFKPHSRTFVAG